MLEPSRPRLLRGFFRRYIHRMREITFYGWQVGVQQEDFTRLLRAEAELGAQEAHAVMLRVLDEQPVILKVPAALAERLVVQARALGVRCRLEPLPPLDKASTREHRQS